MLGWCCHFFLSSFLQSSYWHTHWLYFWLHLGCKQNIKSIDWIFQHYHFLSLQALSVFSPLITSWPTSATLNGMLIFPSTGSIIIATNKNDGKAGYSKIKIFLLLKHHPLFPLSVTLPQTSYFFLRYNFAQANLSLPYKYCSTLLVQTLQHPYVDSTNHHGESVQCWCYHSSTTLCHCWSYWHAQLLFLQSHPCCKQRDKMNERIFQVHFFHFLLFLPTFWTFDHLDPISKHLPSQGSFHQSRHPNSVSQSHSIDNFV